MRRKTLDFTVEQRCWFGSVLRIPLTGVTRPVPDTTGQGFIFVLRCVVLVGGYTCYGPYMGSEDKVLSGGRSLPFHACEVCCQGPCAEPPHEHREASAKEFLTYKPARELRVTETQELNC